LNDTWQLGHPGNGGQNVIFDVRNKLAFAYVTNSMKAGVGHNTRTFRRLHDAVYKCL
jgi:hypothetical protein